MPNSFSSSFGISYPPPTAATNNTLTLSTFRIYTHIIAQKRMTLFANLPFTISNKPTLGLCIFHILSTCAYKQMLRIYADRIIATVAHIGMTRKFYTSTC